MTAQRNERAGCQSRLRSSVLKPIFTMPRTPPHVTECHRAYGPLISTRFASSIPHHGGPRCSSIGFSSTTWMGFTLYSMFKEAYLRECSKICEVAGKLGARIVLELTDQKRLKLSRLGIDVLYNAPRRNVVVVIDMAPYLWPTNTGRIVLSQVRLGLGNGKLPWQACLKRAGLHA